MGSVAFGPNWNESEITDPGWLDTGDNAWQMTAASLVALQSIPGLTVLYAGLVKRKWAVNSMFMVFYAFAMTMVVWCLWGYEIGFGKYMLPFAGRPAPLLTVGREINQSDLPAFPLSQSFPKATMAYFQFVFCAITLVLCAGGYLARMNFTAWMLYVPLWITFCYTPVAFSLWGGGWGAKMGILDYSGGYVIHLSSGTAAFIGAYWIGPRLKHDRENFQPNNIVLMMVGAGILWVGWNGFNGGDPYAASPAASLAVLNTNLCTAISMLTWTCMDIAFYKKPSIIGAVNGMITGLVVITPAAGFIAGWACFILGICSGTIPWVSMNIAGKKMKLFTHHIDDTLGITHTHMVAGTLGGFLTGLFATAEGVASFGDSFPGGAITGYGKQVWLQIVGALFVIGWDLLWTSLIMLFIKYVCRVPLRMSEEDLIIGDDAIHGEDAYCFYDNMAGLEPSQSTHMHAMERMEAMHNEIMRKHPGVLEGQAVSSNSGNGMTTPPTKVEPNNEVKMD